MDIHLTTHPADRGAVRLFVDGALVAELAAGAVQDAAALAAEVERARCLKALAHWVAQWQAHLQAVVDRPDPSERIPTGRQVAFAHGLEDGLSGRTVPHGLPGVPPIRPAQGRCYAWGYDHGAALARALALLRAARAPEEA